LIAQEALTNAIKHGKAKQVRIGLAHSDEKLVLTVRNDGAMFPSAVGRSAGMGLRIMNYRAHLINASVTVEAGELDGTVVTCLVPDSPKKQA
jgi:signal transduction histidine kinase